MIRFSFLCLVIPLISCAQEVGSDKTSKAVGAEKPSVSGETLVVDSVDKHVFSIEELLGQFDPQNHSNFKEVPIDLASRSGMFLRIEVLEAFTMMAEQARKDGVTLKIISATRNFSRQKSIWEGKWNGVRKQNGRNLKTEFPVAAERALEILKYSSMPGTSRHHWGTDIDINNLNNSYFTSGKGKQEYEWLRDHGLDYGFCQVYSEKGEDRANGYEEEKWHWSYIPLSSEMLSSYQTQVDSTTFGGFDGASALNYTEVLKYVSGLAPECK